MVNVRVLLIVLPYLKPGAYLAVVYSTAVLTMNAADS